MVNWETVARTISYEIDNHMKMVAEGMRERNTDKVKIHLTVCEILQSLLSIVNVGALGNGHHRRRRPARSRHCLS